MQTNETLHVEVRSCARHASSSTGMRPRSALHPALRFTLRWHAAQLGAAPPLLPRQPLRRGLLLPPRTLLLPPLPPLPLPPLPLPPLPLRLLLLPLPLPSALLLPRGSGAPSALAARSSGSACDQKGRWQP